MAWAKKTAAKAEKKVFGKGGFKGRYGIGKGKGGFKLGTVLKDLEMIKSRLNVEKKNKSIDVDTWKVGQVYSASTSGFFSNDVTPVIAQGVNSDQRVGNSLKLTGMNFPIQFNSMEQCRSARKLRVMLFRTTNDSYTLASMLADYLDVNPINGLYDMNSPRKYASTKQNGIKLIRSKNYYLKAPSVSTAGDTDESCLSINFAVKLDDILRYDNNTVTVPDGIRYFLYIFCDAGNGDGTTPATVDVPIKTPASGVDVRLAQKYWYVDN